MTWIVLVATLATALVSAVQHTADRRATASAEAPLLPPAIVSSVREMFPH
jgi:hypothetical protein